LDRFDDRLVFRSLDKLNRRLNNTTDDRPTCPSVPDPSRSRSATATATATDEDAMHKRSAPLSARKQRRRRLFPSFLPSVGGFWHWLIYVEL